MIGVQNIEFEKHGDNRGNLISVEELRNIDFEIKRVYYIYGTDTKVVRGKHAHKDLRQIIICINGECDVLLDNGYEKQQYHLDTPSKGIYITGFIWREMFNFSPDCVLLVIVDSFYNADDYIHDYQQFLQATLESELQK